jgi:hypothetical protein
MKQTSFQTVTAKIIADLEQGEVTGPKRWSAANTEGQMAKPLGHNGMPNCGINVLMHWGAALVGGYLFGPKVAFDGVECVFVHGFRPALRRQSDKFRRSAAVLRALVGL